MKKAYYTGYCLLLALMCSCRSSGRLEQALALSGENRAELEKVLAHYSNDPGDCLKYKATCYLIENMPGHYTYTGADVDAYYHKLDSLFSLKDADYYHLNSSLKAIKTDYIQKKRAPDIQCIKASFLINHIDHAFDTQKYPWSANLSFRDFCESVLPYRFLNEPVEDWIPLYSACIRHVTDSLIRAGASDSSACASVFQYVKDPPTDVSLSFSPVLEYYPSGLLRVQTEWSAGTCKELTLLGLYMMHSTGIPVAYDFTPQWANRSRTHSWSALVLNGRTIPFQMKDHAQPFGQHLTGNPGKYVKVYRRTYGIQYENPVMQHMQEDVPSVFHDIHYKDVTHLYGPCTDLEVKLSTPLPVDRKTAYLMLYDNQKWIPVHWAKIKRSKATFTKVRSIDFVFLTMCYDGGEFYPASFPVRVNEKGEGKQLVPNRETTVSVSLKRKHPNLNVMDIPDMVRNGIFQAACLPDFSDAVQLHVIDSVEDVVPHTVWIDVPDQFRYFRYLSADSGHVNMAEIEVYDREGEKLSGKIIGTDEAKLRHADKTKLFDGNLLSYFKTKQPSGGWGGLDFMKKKSIGKIVYCPRNDENFIKEGDNYELFYYEHGWKSLGQKTGTETGGELVFDHVPTNALLLLKNHSGGTEERPFTYENGQQVWY
jgi:hypothetical protein